MESYILNKREHYEKVLGGPFLVELVRLLKLPIPEIKATKRTSRSWGVKTQVFGRKEDPKTADISFGTINGDCDMGINTAVHDAIARLCYRHRAALNPHFFGRIGWQKFDGATIALTEAQKMKFSPLLVYNQDLEQYVKNLQMDLLEALFDNEALREEVETQRLKVDKLEEENLEIPRMRQELKSSRTISHAKDIEIQKLKEQLQDIQGRHKKLRVDRENLAEELEEIKSTQKKPQWGQ